MSILFELIISILYCMDLFEIFYYNFNVSEVLFMYDLANRMEIAKRINRIRSAKKITQEKMAELVDVSYTTYTKIEHGGQNLTVKHLVNIARVLELSTDLILFEHSPQDKLIYTDLINTFEFESKLSDVKNSIDDILKMKNGKISSSG